jgi:hypothetical protein
MMRAQVSLEYLMLFLVSICLLSISAYALMGIRDYSEKAAEELRFRHSASHLANAANEVCALGAGNSRLLELQHGMSVGYGDGQMRMAWPGLRYEKEALCEVETADVSGLVQVKNEDGLIMIRERSSCRTCRG